MKRFAGFFNPQIEPPEVFAFFQLTGSAFAIRQSIRRNPVFLLTGCHDARPILHSEPKTLKKINCLCREKWLTFNVKRYILKYD